MLILLFNLNIHAFFAKIKRMNKALTTIQLQQLGAKIKLWGKQLGFQQVGITDINLETAEQRLKAWLAKGWYGEMHYLQERISMRTHPQELLPGTLRIISVRINYLPPNPKFTETLTAKNKAYISRYALGRDYHKLIRRRLVKLAKQITAQTGELNYRVFTDSAPVLEKPLAEKAGLGWQGKNNLILNRQAQHRGHS